MSQQKQSFIHPFTGFLVHDGLSSIFDSLKVGRLGDALERLFWLVSFLDEGMQNTLANEIKEMKEYNKNYGHFNREKFHSLLRKVMFALHNQGYFLGAKFFGVDVNKMADEL